MKKRRKIGLAIGGGAAYGLSAIGVLKVLEDNNIPVDAIAGTSIGAVIGALYAAGYDADSLKKEVSSVEWKELLDFVLPEKGLVSGKKIEQFVRDLIGNKKFEDLKIPLFLTAVDVKKERLIIFNKGDVASAVRASIAIPGVFTPVETKDMTLVDGGILDPIPVDLLKDKVDFTIALYYQKNPTSRVYKISKPRKSKFLQSLKSNFLETEFNYLEQLLKKGKLRLPFPFRWVLSPNYIYKWVKKQDIPASSLKILEVAKKAHVMMTDQIAYLKLEIDKPDILVLPKLFHMNWLEFDKQDYARHQGELAMQNKLPELKKLLRKRKR
ncbi:MAG: patatin-like phospholipase family protein [Nanoarchaeota archaeon]|nr:patatin-like phospholipase family protein [Nanoarchaeota archaeon]MCG2718808.1 patatin-like phospholipase family protein [Nanoarchaeota archaeon]